MGTVYKSTFIFALLHCIYIFKTKPKNICYYNIGPFYLRRIGTRKSPLKVNLFKMDQNLESFEGDFFLKVKQEHVNKLMLYKIEVIVTVC